LKPGAHCPPAGEQGTTLLPQARRASPVRPAGQAHTARWFTTVQRALVPQAAVVAAQGSAHWLLMQARLAGQLELERQPSTQVTPWQISWLLQSSSSLGQHTGDESRQLLQDSYVPDPDPKDQYVFLCASRTGIRNDPSIKKQKIERSDPKLYLK
jgi:hypothetical protein